MCAPRRTCVVFFYEKHELKLEGRRILPRANRRSELSELLRQLSEADLHHLLIFNRHVDKPKRVANILDPAGIIGH